MFVVTDEIISSWISHFLWPFFRLSSFFVIVPIFGSRLVPVRVRLGLAIVITALVYPLLPEMPILQAVDVATFLLIIEQILIGITMGFLVLMVLQIFVLAGQTIALQMGLGFASMIDPSNGVSVAVLSQWYQVLVTLVFLAINGHLLVLDVMIQSFYSLPVGAGIFQADQWFVLAEFGAWMFRASLMLALPAITALLLVNLAFGIMTRAAPQLNVFALGFPITMIGGLVVVWVSYAAAAPLVQEFLQVHVDFMRALLRQ